MKKILLTISGLLAMASITQLEARWHANINFGYHRPRHVYRSYRPVYVQEPVYYPTYYPYTPVQYYPVYQQPVVEYVDEPEVAMMQDGFNMMFDAISHSSKRSSRRRWKR